MGVTIGQAYEDGFEVDGPDPDSPDAVSISRDLSEAEAKAREAQAAENEAHAATVAAERAAQADHLATMETSDPNNPQDANGNVAGVEDDGSGEDFDPSEHTAAEVKAHLAKEDVDEAEKQKVLAQEEAAEKPRTTVTESKEAQSVPPFDPNDHGAPEVREYLRNASAAERKRVIGLEKKRDKPRSTIVNFND